MRRATAGLVAGLMAASSLLSVTAGPAAAQAVNRIGNFGDWSLLSDTLTGPRLCFLTARPSASEPSGLNREPGRAYVSAWPKDGIRSEVSLMLGFSAKRSEAITITIGSSSFQLFSKDRRAFVDDPTQELKLLEAMKKGAKMSISATSERGTKITDTYSLSGFGQGFQQLAERCS